MPKVSVLYFDSKDIVRLLNAEVKEGKLKIDRSTFLIDEDIKPKILKRGSIRTTYRPFYIIRHDKIVPLDWMEDPKGKIIGLVNPISPATLTSVIRNQRLQNLLRYKLDKLTLVMLLAAGFVIGIMFGMVLGFSIKP